MRKISICIIILFIIITTGCDKKQPEKQGLGLVETPEMLYKSFKTAGDKAYTGAAPEMAADVDLSPYFPKPGDQGQIGSCTGWAVAYAAKSYHENVEREWGVNSNEQIFSPSFIYNQVNGGFDMGAPLEAAIGIVIITGAASLETMPYTEEYRRRPSQAAYNEAVQFRAKSFARVNTSNPEAVKAILAGGNPVIIGMNLYESFYNYKGGIYNNASGASVGGHAMCVVGYDDTKKAFKIINSWGTWWGEQGYFRVDYGVFANEVIAGFVMYDRVTTNPKTAAPPVDVEASDGASRDRVIVTWASAAYAVSYKIYRSTGPSENFLQVGETKGTTFIDRRAAPGKMYYYAVNSVSSSGKESALSESNRGNTAGPEKELGIPVHLQGLFDEEAVYLKWSSVSGIEGYYIYRFDRESNNYLRIGRTVNTNFRHKEKFNNKETIWYIVTAYKDSKESGATAPVGIKVEKEVRDLKPPGKVKASEGTYADKIEISWHRVEEAGGYKLYKYFMDTEEWKLYKELEETSYTDTEVTLLQAYYSIFAVNSTAVSSPTEPVWGYIKEYAKNVETKSYDDEEYYDDSDYFRDTDYKDENKYKDDKFFDKKEQEENKYNRFEDEERKKDTEFLNDITTTSEEEILDNLRDKTDTKDTKEEKAAQDITKEEMNKSDKDFFEDDKDFFDDDKSFSGEKGKDMLNSDKKKDLLKDEDDDFFGDDDDFF